MSIESGVYAILSTDPELAAWFQVPADQLASHVYRAGAAVDPPDHFLVIRWEDTAGAPGTFRALPGMTLRAHHRSRSYELVDGILDLCKNILTAVVHEQGITQIDWRGRSPDLFDDGYGTATRFDTYAVAGGIATGRA